MIDSSNELYPIKDLKGLETLANRIQSFPLFMDCSTIESYRRVNFDEDECVRIAEALIDMWDEIGVEDAQDLIYDAFDPIFSSDSPDRFSEAHGRFHVMQQLHAPYLILSATEFLSIIDNPIEVKKLMIGSFSSHVVYYYLNHLDRRYTDPHILAELAKPASEEEQFDLFEIARKQNEGQKLSNEVIEARRFVREGVFPEDIKERDANFVLAYYDELASRAREVVGGSDIELYMKHDQMPFQLAFSSVIQRARITVLAEKNRKRLVQARAELFN